MLAGAVPHDINGVAPFQMIDLVHDDIHADVGKEHEGNKDGDQAAAEALAAAACNVQVTPCA